MRHLAALAKASSFLIVVAFLLARGVINSSLGKKIAFLIIQRFGKSSLGLAYSVIAADMFIAPAFPSNTARSGVLFPIVNALAVDSGSLAVFLACRLSSCQKTLTLKNTSINQRYKLKSNIFFLLYL